MSNEHFSSVLCLADLLALCMVLRLLADLSDVCRLLEFSPRPNLQTSPTS